jgi:arginine N-succinyltransferase
LAELLPPLESGPGGTTSPLWDALGRKFTRLHYAKADALSRHDKEFIWRLFPQMPIHASLLPQEVQNIIGEVGPQTVGARRLLEGIGFCYNGSVDPFDGGPHYEAVTDDIPLVRDAKWCRADVGEGGPSALPGIAAVVEDAAPHFRAVWSDLEVVGDTVRIPEDAHTRLGAPDRLLVCLHPRRRHGD